MYGRGLARASTVQPALLLLPFVGNPEVEGNKTVQRLSRRRALGVLVGTAAAAAWPLWGDAVTARKSLGRLNPIIVENLKVGSRDWAIGAAGTRAADDTNMQIQGYASGTSVNLGDSLDFHVSAKPQTEFTIAVYRFGYYRGQGARLVHTSRQFSGVAHPRPKPDPLTGIISCGWPSTWTLEVPTSWTSGLYLAVFTTTDGWRSATPFVVRDDGGEAALCVVLPFTTYQAYNQWPQDGSTGKSLYSGYEPANGLTGHAGPASASSLSSNRRAVKVSFDRPYSGKGIPSRFDGDRDFISWAEAAGYDITYATSVDLHAGRVDPARFAGLIFPGHDEYWSTPMRDVAAAGVARGTSLAFMSANNVYWHIRFERSEDGRPDRDIVCYKGYEDPDPGAYGATTQWRLMAPESANAEQGLLGVQYNGIVPEPVALVVRSADHWFWAGCGVGDRDEDGPLGRRRSGRTGRRGDPPRWGEADPAV